MSGRADFLVRKVIWGTDAATRLSPRRRIEISQKITDILSQPSWSICSLLPEHSFKPKKEFSVTPEKLRHLLKLSALPAPKSVEEEKEMLQTLESQIHFVKEIQKVNTKHVEPLVAIRDETQESNNEQEITLKTLQPWLDLETKVGKNGTVRREAKKYETKPAIPFDPFGLGPSRESRQKGRYFYVKRQKKSKPAIGSVTSVNGKEAT